MKSKAFLLLPLLLPLQSFAVDCELEAQPDAARLPQLAQP
jgi:hypothetical protein